MKQHITVEQLDSLTIKQKHELERFFNPELDDDYMWGLNSLEVTIGKMIEFLTMKGQNFWINYDRNPDLFTLTKGKKPYPDDPNLEHLTPELCDALWESVKEVLEKE